MTRQRMKGGGAGAHVRRREGEQDAVLTLYRRGRINEAALDKQLDAIQQEEAALREKVAQAQAQAQQIGAREERLRGAGALLRRLQVRLEEPLTHALQRELIEELVARIQVGVEPDGLSRRGKPKRRAVITVTYVFDDPAIMSRSPRRGG